MMSHSSLRARRAAKLTVIKDSSEPSIQERMRNRLRRCWRRLCSVFWTARSCRSLSFVRVNRFFSTRKVLSPTRSLTRDQGPIKAGESEEYDDGDDHHARADLEDSEVFR